MSLAASTCMSPWSTNDEFLCCACRHEPVHINTEVWAFGVIAMELLYEKYPWSANVLSLVRTSACVTGHMHV